MKERSGFSGKLGFVFAAAGSAVGLGNLWRFPYLAARYGGGLFLLIYILLVVTVGFVLMVTEVSVGRRAQKNVYDSYRALDRRFSFIGVLGVIIPFFIASYYSVVGGWVIKYIVTFLSGSGAETAAPGYFDQYIASPAAPLIYHAVFLLISFSILILGVQKGIEKTNKILMPALILLSIVIAVKSIMLPGGMEGVKYFLIPDFKHFSFHTVLAALGQMFYSLSLAMGVMVTYGSYLSKKEDIVKGIKLAEVFDTVIAFLGGMMILPAVFATAGDTPETMNAGPSLLFVTLPRVFHSMKFGDIFAALFFFLVLFAALTSMVSLMEVFIAFLIDKFQFGRIKATACVCLLAFILGIPCSLGFGVWEQVRLFGMNLFDLIDFIANSVLMPLTAIFTCVFVGYFWGVKNIINEVELSGEFHHKKYYTIMIRYIVPVSIAFVWVSSVFKFY